MHTYKYIQMYTLKGKVNDLVSKVAKRATVKSKDCLFNLETEWLLMFLVKLSFVKYL